jgi:hypothetical protein
MREYDNPCDEPEDSWWVNEQIEERIHTLKSEWEDSPPIHLYAWLEQAYPEIFKQWQSIYDIEREEV